MPRFKIYAGLSGGFGGANYRFTDEYETEEEACLDAYNEAVEEYVSYEGCHGLLDWGECKEALLEDKEEGEDITDEDVDDYYRSEIEGWIEYYAIMISDDDIEEEEE